MAVIVAPSTVTLSALLSSDNLFLTASPTFLPDASCVKVVGFVREVGSVNILIPTALWLSTTAIAVDDLGTIEGGDYLTDVSGFSGASLTLAATRTAVTDTGRKGNYWYVSTVNSPT